MALFYGWDSTDSMLQRHYKEIVNFLRSWYSIDGPQKDERLICLQRHPVVLNLGLLDWESSTLTSRQKIEVKKSGCIVAGQMELW